MVLFVVLKQTRDSYAMVVKARNPSSTPRLKYMGAHNETDSPKSSLFSLNSKNRIIKPKTQSMSNLFVVVDSDGNDDWDPSSALSFSSDH